MDTNTRSIVGLAWARVLGLPDDTLLTPADWRLGRVDDTMITFVQLWDHRVLVGPQRFLDQVADVPNEMLVDGPSLLALSAELPGGPGRLQAATSLAFLDTYVPGEELKTTTVSDDRAVVADLERRCPPDDVAEVGLSSMTWKIAVFDEADEPVAGAGFAEWQGIVADLGVLTPLPVRRAGHGLIAAGIATNEALDRGLVPQWRGRADDQVARRLARRLGFRAVGTQTTISLIG
jgi:hypothetical protein